MSDMNDFMDGWISQLHQLYLENCVKVGVSESDVQTFIATAVGGPILGIVTQLYGDSVSDRAMLSLIAQQAQYIGNLDGKYRQWAINGQRDDGSAYDINRWTSYAKQVATDISQIGGMALDVSAFGSEYAAAQETGQQLTDPSNWPSWSKWLIGAAAAVTFGPALINLVASLIKKNKQQSAA